MFKKSWIMVSVLLLCSSLSFAQEYGRKSSLNKELKECWDPISGLVTTTSNTCFTFYQVVYTWISELEKECKNVPMVKVKSAEINDAFDLLDLDKTLTKDEKEQVKSGIIKSVKMAKEACDESKESKIKLLRQRVLGKQ